MTDKHIEFSPVLDCFQCALGVIIISVFVLPLDQYFVIKISGADKYTKSGLIYNELT